MNEEILSMQKMQEILEILVAKTEMLVETTAQTQEHLFNLEEKMDNRFDKVDERLDYHETWFNRIEGQLSGMATKEDFNQLTGSFNKLVGILDKDQVISSYDATRVSYSEPIG